MRPDSITPTLHRINWDQIWLKSWEAPAVFGYRSPPSSHFAAASAWHLQVLQWTPTALGFWESNYLRANGEDASFGDSLSGLQRSSEHLTRRPPPANSATACLASCTSTLWMETCPTPHAIPSPKSCLWCSFTHWGRGKYKAGKERTRASNRFSSTLDSYPVHPGKLPPCPSSLLPLPFLTFSITSSPLPVPAPDTKQTKRRARCARSLVWSQLSMQRACLSCTPARARPLLGMHRWRVFTLTKWPNLVEISQK